MQEQNAHGYFFFGYMSTFLANTRTLLVTILRFVLRWKRLSFVFLFLSMIAPAA